MSLRIGIVGLPNVGKSTLFNALTRACVPAQNFPFCTIDPNVGVVAVPDERLAQLAAVSKSARTIPTSVEFVDIAGLVAGAHKGEGLGNQFLAAIRECDAIAEVVRVFGGDVIHVAGRVDPAADVETIGLELAMADLATVRKRMDKTEGKARSGDKDGVTELATLREWEAHLNTGKPVRDVAASFSSPSERGGPTTAATLARELHLLTAKPLLYVLNVDEKEQLAVPEEEWRGRFAFLRDAGMRRGGAAQRPSVAKGEGGSPPAKVPADSHTDGRGRGPAPTTPTSERRAEAELPHDRARRGGIEQSEDTTGVAPSFVVLCAKIEAELAELPEADADAMRADLGVRERGLDTLAAAAYRLLDLVTFLTSGEPETRAWTVRSGATMPEAAGVIHTDFAKTFIRADVIPWRDFIACGGWSGARASGDLRTEGKESIIRDGDVVYFHVNA